MARHLVVDDIQFRHDKFREILVPLGHEIDHAYTVTEAVTFMRERMIMVDPPDPYGVIFLDHDIDSGYDRRDVVHFTRWLLANDWLVAALKKAGTIFFVHSQNSVGAQNLRFDIAAHGFPVKVCPFKGDPPVGSSLPIPE